MRGKQDHSRERSLRRDQTEAERMLWAQLRGRRLQDFRFRRQHRVGPYIVDFVCTERRLVIELDGSQHLDAVDYDAARSQFLQRQGYRVVRFWNDDVMLRMTDVLDELLRLSRTPHPLPSQGQALRSLREPVPRSAPRPLRMAQGRSVVRAPVARKQHALTPAARGEGRG